MIRTRCDINHVAMSYTFDKVVAGDASRDIFVTGPTLDPSEILTPLRDQHVCLSSALPSQEIVEQFVNLIQDQGQIRTDDWHSRAMCCIWKMGDQYQVECRTYATTGPNSWAKINYKGSAASIAASIVAFFTSSSVFGQTVRRLMKEKTLVQKFTFSRTSEEESLQIILERLSKINTSLYFLFFDLNR